MIKKHIKHFQGRKQNHREKHQNYPKAGGKITSKDIRIVPRQEQTQRKISKLCQIMSKQETNQNYSKEVGKIRSKNIKIIPRIDKIIRNKYQDYSKAGGKTTSKNIKIIPK